MSELKCTHSCSDCSRLGCRSASEEQYPPFCLTTNVDKALLEETLEIYRNDPEQGLIARTSACIEGEFYGRLTRVEETIEFIKRMGYKKIGIASCVGLMREASIFARILKAKGIEYFTVGCKVGAQDKTEIGVPNEKKLNGGCGHESMCNPIMQAKTLAAHGCDFNIVIRTALHKNGKYHLGVGGGITAESDLEFEYEETLQKAKAILDALQ